MKLVYLGLLIFVVLFLAAIVINGVQWKEETEEFTVKCEAAGGRMYAPKSVKGWPDLLCLDKDIFIEVE